MYKREIEQRIRQISDTFKVLVVTGPRQVGKTTLLESMMPKNMTKISLDDETLRTEAKENPQFFLNTYKAPLFIDEVQYAPELLPYIKMRVDASNEKSQYWLSGSQAFNLMEGVSESLAGRAGIVEMNSFTYRELSRLLDKTAVFDPSQIKESSPILTDEVFERIFVGGMPELYNTPEISRNDFFDSYINTYIQRDVRQVKNVGSLEDFRRFMKDIALRNGKPLNYSDIAAEIGVSSVTIKTWVSILITSGIIVLLEPFYTKKLKRLTHMPEIIFMDSGLACFLAGFETVFGLQSSEYAGSFLEAYVISELVKGYRNNGLQTNFTYIRNKETEEIDLLIERDLVLYPFEIKKTSNPKPEMLKNFQMLDNVDSKVGVGGLICLYDKMMPLGEKKFVIPISSVIAG
ncbi:ATP-binding protein [Candidatus Saccharibacteria bacterium]|nr:ATP-binding protein [Candidatus Saccharibacteria bacterium]